MKAWILAARLRTLPLSVSGILVAAALSAWYDLFDLTLFLLALTTTLGFQILSNFANDYGDGIKGTDQAGRIGPDRALQSGLLSASDLKKGMWVMALFSALTATLLIYLAFGKEQWLIAMCYLLLGAAAIIAAIRYTVGDSAYGYKGFGDLFVLVFFGFVGVAGAYFLFTKHFSTDAWSLSLTIGLLSVAVLNLNNMRDRISDSGSGKVTMAVRMGRNKAVAYHLTLIVTALISAIWTLVNRMESGLDLIPLLALLPLIPHAIRVWKHREPASLDPELKTVALSTFGFSLLLFVLALIN
jgi:1,4-dihydroxy-2-naphthoate octaprenyltransferase